MIQVSWWLYNPFNYKAGCFLEGGKRWHWGEGMGPLTSHDFSVFYLTFSPRFSVPDFRLTPRVVRWPELLEGFQGIPRAQRSAGSQPGGGENAMLAMGFATFLFPDSSLVSGWYNPFEKIWVEMKLKVGSSPQGGIRLTIVKPSFSLQMVITCA